MGVLFALLGKNPLTALYVYFVEPVLASRVEITAALNRAYQQKVDVVDTTGEALQELGGIHGAAGTARDDCR